MSDWNGRERPPGTRGTPPPKGRPVTLPPVPDPHRYAIADLERETGLPARTIRYYISQGLLPPAHGRGPGATYDLGHLLRLKMIQRLKAEHLPLEEIKRRLGDLTDEDIETMLNIQSRPTEDRWRRIQLHPDIELHVRERGGFEIDRALERAVDLIVGYAHAVVDGLEDRRE
ncbi:MAG TPA: MerR family transcriptional regulator [Thermomicrobiales bacterium]